MRFLLQAMPAILVSTFVFTQSHAKVMTCTIDGVTIANGSSIVAYSAKQVPYGSTCTSQVRNCKSGSLSGSYPYSTCSVAPPSACNFNGQSIASGQSVTAYATSSVPYGQSCVSQQRSCSNGTLSGSYTNSSCTVAPQACTTKTIDFNNFPEVYSVGVNAQVIDGVTISSNRDLMNIEVFDSTPAFPNKELWMAVRQFDDNGDPVTVLDSKLSIILPKDAVSAEVQIAFWPTMQNYPIQFTSGGVVKLVDFLWFDWRSYGYPQYLMATETVHFDYTVPNRRIDIQNAVNPLTRGIEVKLNNLRYTVCE